MKNIKRFLWIGIITLLNTPISVLAQGGTPPGGIVIGSPITSSSIGEILDKIIDFLLLIAGPIAIIMTIWGGFLFVTAGGNQEKVKTAQHTLFYVVIGVAILILSKGVVSLINSVL